MRFDVWVRDKAVELTDLDADEVAEMIDMALYRYFMSEDYSIEKM